MEVTVPPLCELLLNVYVFEGQKYLIISKIIKNKNIFYLSQLSRMCNIGDECLIHSEISNFKCIYSSYIISEKSGKSYRGSKENNKNFIYIQYLNDMDGSPHHISTNKVIKEFSTPSYYENEYYDYICQIMNDKEYELFINFDKRPKNIEVYFDENQYKIEKSGRYTFKSNSLNDLHYIEFRVSSHLYLTGFTYYLREKNEELEIIANETIHGYFSGDEDILNYTYSFEDNVTSFYLEIFSSDLKLKIEDLSGNCCDFPKDFQDLKATELKKYTVEDSNITTLARRKIKISFQYSGISEPRRHFRFRLLPIYYQGINIIYLNEGHEAICNPKFVGQYCYFFFPLPISLIKKDKIAINGYYENNLGANIPIYGKQISLRKELTRTNFEDFGDYKIKGNNYIEYEITANYSVNNYNYFIGFFETDGNSSIRIAYSITPYSSIFEDEGFGIAPGEYKFYSIFGKKGDQKIKPKLEGIQNKTEFQGYLSIMKVNKKFILSTINNTISKKNINIEDVIIMDMWDDLGKTDSESELILSSIRSHLCSFYLKYDIIEKVGSYLCLVFTAERYINSFMLY